MDFWTATTAERLLYYNWKVETDLTHIELYGELIPVHTLNFLQYCEWVRLNEKPKIATTPLLDVVDIDFEEICVL